MRHFCQHLLNTMGTERRRGRETKAKRGRQRRRQRNGTCVCCICTCIQVSFVLFLFFIFAVFVLQLLDIIVVGAVFGAFPFQIKHSVVTFICCTLFKLVFQFCGSYPHTHTHSGWHRQRQWHTHTQRLGHNTIMAAIFAFRIILISLPSLLASFSLFYFGFATTFIPIPTAIPQFQIPNPHPLRPLSVTLTKQWFFGQIFRGVASLFRYVSLSPFSGVGI